MQAGGAPRRVWHQDATCLWGTQTAAAQATLAVQWQCPPLTARHQPQQLSSTAPAQTQAAVEALQAHLGRPLAALLCGEVGGGNCLDPLVTGARLGLPVLDADLMGRAFPELQVVVGGWLAA